MCRTRRALALVTLYLVGLAQSWDIAVTNGNLLEFYTNDTKTDTVHFNSYNLAALAHDEVHNMMLFVDKQTDNDAICGYNISSKENKCYTERNGRNIHDLAFDPATELLFFSDTNERSINWISLKRGSNNNIYGNLLIKMADGIPTDVAVDSCRGYVYWINTNLATSVIERARFNGYERQVVINATSLSINTTYKLEPHSLAIDQQTQKIYWIEAESSSRYRICYTDLNGKRITFFSTIKYKSAAAKTKSNTLTVSKSYLFWVDWCSICAIDVWRLPKTIETASNSKYYFTHFTLQDLHIEKVTVGMAANYPIEEQRQGINDCEPLMRIVRNKSEGPFCVHGMKVNGQSLCKCAPGYTGERCDVSVCENYCLHGNYSFNDEGLPKCRCNAGYSGERCQVYACHGYCLNNGDCSLNEKSKPVCQCKGHYGGDRCEVSDCLNYCIHGNCSFNEGGFPECRCNAGYSGERCEVYACHGYCLNNGDCSLNKNEPVCQCKGDFVGVRCEVPDCPNCSFNKKGLPEYKCNAGYSGERCEVYACHGYCLNNGDCSLNEEDEPFCECIGNYVGLRCEVAPNVTFNN